MTIHKTQPYNFTHTLKKSNLWIWGCASLFKCYNLLAEILIVCGVHNFTKKKRTLSTNYYHVYPLDTLLKETITVVFSG